MKYTVLVTGANRGLGFEIAKQFALQGSFVILGVRDPKEGPITVKKLEGLGIKDDQMDFTQIDLEDVDSIEHTRMFIEKQYPNLDYLVNNAGISGDMEKKALDTTVGDIQHTMDVNLFGTFELIKRLVPILMGNQGKIANLTGPFQATAFYNPTAYRVSKVALNALIQSIAVDFYRDKLPVSIFGIFPGGVSTDINNHRKGPYMKSVEEGGKFVASILLDGRNHNGELIGPDGKVFSTIRV